MIRTARPEDVIHFAQIERAAGAAFREQDMASVAADEPLPAHELLAYQRAGRAWVATDDADEPIAYLVLDIVDEAAHVEQVSVDPAFAHHRLGQALLDTAAAWARERGLRAMTLTTFANVPWNAPYYVRLGFRVVPEQEWTPGLRHIRAHEAAIGLDAWPRVVMQRPVGCEAVLDTGHGTGIDVQTLKGVIHDEAAFARWASESVDPVLDVIGPLFRGDLDAAEAALDRISASAEPNVQFRLRALGADIIRDRGHFAEAVARYELLLADYAGTSREAVLRQHRGKAHFAAGDFGAAREDFAAALQLRRRQGADADLIESSLIALGRADEEISRVQQTQDQVPDS